MNVLMKVCCGSVVGILTVGLLGCGCLFPYKPNTLTNQYVDLYAEAESLRYDGEYRAAVEKYEQAFKIRPRSRKVIDVSYVPQFKYCIAFCYAKVAETEVDDSFYLKAEAAVKESYQTARLQSDQVDILYLWGYILFKRGQYAEALAKYEALLEIDLQRGFRNRSLLKGVLYAIEKTYLELGEKAVAPRAFRQLEARLEIALQNRVSDGSLEEALSSLGQMYLEMGGETAARRAFGQLEILLEIAVQSGVYDRYFSYVLYVLGAGYLELGDEVAARRIFERVESLLEIVLQSGTRDIGLPHDVYILGARYLELDDEVAARRIYRQLLENFPDSYLHALFKDEMEARFLEK